MYVGSRFHSFMRSDDTHNIYETQRPILLMCLEGQGIDLISLPSTQAIDEEVCKKAVHNAFHAGVNFFDTSPFYGNTKSETVRG